MELVNLELKPAEAEAETTEAKENERPLYPYGLCLHVTDETLAKLGLEGCDVGDEIRIMAIGKVIGTSEQEYEGGKHSTLDVQLVEMGCEESGEEDEEGAHSKAARTLYGKGE